MNNENALVPLEGYAIAKQTVDIAAIMRENVGAAGITKFDFDKIKVPSQGATRWQIQTLDGDEAVKELRGVIIAFADRRVFYEKGFDQRGSDDTGIPDCASDDCVTGRGKPGGECAACPYAEFGSDTNTGGQRCKKYRDLFLVTPQNVLPTVLQVPPTSWRDCHQYFLRLANFGKKFSQVETVLTLEKTKSKSNIDYSHINFKAGQALDDASCKMFAGYAENFAKSMKNSSR